MVRAIKFRAKTDNGDWKYGDLHLLSTVPHIHTDINISHRCPIDTKTIGQFTGLKDKNDKEVYDGDIISLPLSDGSCVTHQIRISEEYLSVEIKNLTVDGMRCDFDIFGQLKYSWWQEYKYDIEVIGNIYDNPELIDE